MVNIPHLADSGEAIAADTPHLAGGQSDEGIITLFYHELSGNPSTAHQLASPPPNQLNIVD